MFREKDPDPDGKQLAATQEPLAEATKLVQQLKQYAGDRIKTHLLAFEVTFQGLSHASYQTCTATSISAYFWTLLACQHSLRTHILECVLAVSSDVARNDRQHRLNM